jgi:hypothetical protein
MELGWVVWSYLRAEGLREDEEVTRDRVLGPDEVRRLREDEARE